MDSDTDLRYTPFSRYGAYHGISLIDPAERTDTDAEAGLWLRCVHADAAREVLRIEPVDGAGRPLPFAVRPDEAELRLDGEQADAAVRIAIDAAGVVRFRAEGCGVRLTARPGGLVAVADPDGSLLMALPGADRFHRLVPLAGTAAFDAEALAARPRRITAVLRPDDDGLAEAALENSRGEQPAAEHPSPFDAIVAENRAAFDRFAAPCADAPEAFRDAARAAAWIDWADTVAPCGLFTRPAMLMSKNWMTSVWAWDHAFNAWALALGHPDAAWDALLLPFDHQLPNGQIPDTVNDTHLGTCCVKPPVHGWILSRMMAASPAVADRDRLAAFYPKLAAWTRWWLTARDPEGTGLPRYHHGYDSGWDNATVFDVGFPVRAPEAAAFLVLQLDALADLADRLDKEEASSWRAEADRVLAALLEQLWDGKRFLCRRAADGAVNEQSDSVFGCLPIVLGDRLPADIVRALAAEIPRHLTEWGPATEHPDSPLYQPDGYWRGPIWAPSTMVLVDGLARAGETALARDVATRFCRLCAKSGFAENFDAVTGAPLRDRAYTWTASVFLVSARFLKENEEPA